MTARRLLVPAFAALALAACAQTPKSSDPSATGRTPALRPAAPQFTATPGLTVRERLKRAVELLDEGSAGQARAELVAVLKEDADNAAARGLLRQIDEDPVALLGVQHFTYTVRPGETLSELAARFLGDPMKFYALARYNGIAAPAQMERGQQLKIPGVPRAAPAPRREPAPGKPAAGAAQTPPAPAAPQRNPGRAAQLRASGLEQMNKGAIDRAVALLRQALQFDPANALIQRDLDRALRIQTTVRQRR
jgi:LysM repeat protein